MHEKKQFFLEIGARDFLFIDNFSLAPFSYIKACKTIFHTYQPSTITLNVWEASSQLLSCKERKNWLLCFCLLDGKG